MVQKAVIQWTIQGAGKFDILFVNDFGLPFFSGFAFFFILLGFVIYLGLRYAKKRNWPFLKLGLWCTAFILLGYSTYITPLVRSNADPSLDMYNVDNPVSLVGYLGREQYGDWPIVYGQDFTARYTSADIKDTYVKGEKEYELKGKKQEIDYAPEDKHLLPRMWDNSNDQGHADYYLAYTDNVSKNPQTGEYEGKPTMGENIYFFLSYQTNWMYWRYFMWNFAGKQDDVQGISTGNVRDGNWKSGIGFLDQMRLGDQSKLPDTLKNNKANNNLYFLPFILGILGLVYQIKKDKRNAFVNGLLFFFTGMAIVLYLNQAGNQPRERDYAYVGSFYAFAVWIGLGVMYVKELLGKALKKDNLANYAAAGICTLAVPVLMASQEWNDHDRSKKVLARDLAIDYLESCAPNAIVISYGDNDTYPLWYAQEVEGIRKDIRVINYSLLGTDWYINELRYKVNNSGPMDPIWTKEQILGSNRDVVYYHQMPGIDPNQYNDLYTMMKDWAGSDDPKKMWQPPNYESTVNVFPSKKVKIPVDVNFVRQNGTVNASDSVVNDVMFDIPKNAIYKNDAAILNIMASNKWKRPIYFTSAGASGLGFDKYIRQDGLTYRFVPVLDKKAGGLTQTNLDSANYRMINKFAFGNANVPGVYFDEENRRHLMGLRRSYAMAAINYAENDRKEDGRKLLNKCDAGMLEENMPYGLVSRFQEHDRTSLLMLQAAYICEDSLLANKITRSLKKDLEQQLKYYETLSDTRRESFDYTNNRGQKDGDYNDAIQMLQEIANFDIKYKNPPPPVIPPKSLEKGGPVPVPPPMVKDTGKKKGG
jgi:hypothetical protein